MKAEKLISKILSTTPTLIIVLDREGRIVLFNEACEKSIGYSQDELRGKPIDSLLEESEHSDVIQILDDLIRTGKSSKYINSLKRKKGANIIVAWSNSVLKDEKTGELRVLAIGIDITEKVQAEKALIASEAKSKAILETVVDGIVTTDEDGQILSFNKAAEDIFGYSADEVLGRKINMLMPHPYREEHDSYMQRYRETGDKRIIGIGREAEGLRKNGDTFPMDLAVSEISWEKSRIFTGIIRDITERRILEQEVLRVGDLERQRIGQELHDSLGQLLTGISLLSRNIADRLSANALPGAEEVGEIAGLVKEADSIARNLAHTLIPVEIENEGLSLALEKLCKQTSSLSSIECVYEDKNGIQVENRIAALHIYRIAQEAIHNAVKHANARHIKVQIYFENDLFVLRVEDDGVGFEEKKSLGSGMGLRLMRYRSRVLGGELDITRTPENKTRVECRVPMKSMSQVTQPV